MHKLKTSKRGYATNGVYFTIEEEREIVVLKVICKLCNKVISNENSATVVVESKGRPIGKDFKGNPKYSSLVDTICYICVEHCEDNK